MWTYDNRQFLKFCFIFLGLGSMINFSFGVYAWSAEHILNGILLAMVSIGIGKIHLNHHIVKVK